MIQFFKFSLLLLIFSIGTPLAAQVVIEGTAKDSENKEGLPFAHIYIEGTPVVTVSDIDGVFSISFPEADKDKKLVISAIGYENYSEDITKVLSKKTKDFLLSSATFDLVEAVVRSPEKIVQDALDKINENYWTEKFMTEGFYRKAAFENDKFAYLTEAVVNIYNDGYQKIGPDNISLEITQLRNSDDFRDIETLQGLNPLFIGLYKQDRVKNRDLQKFLDRQKQGRAKMEMSSYNDESIYIISMENYKLYIGFENDEIYRVDINSEIFTSSHQYRKYKGKLYHFYHRRKFYTKKGPKVTAALIHKYGDRDLLQEAKQEVGFVEENPNIDADVAYDRLQMRIKEKQREISKTALQAETKIDNLGWIHEFTATSISLNSEEKYKSVANIDMREDVFKTVVYYDDYFWNNYNFSADSKYLQKIKADLEDASGGTPLDQQFTEVGKKNNATSKKFRKREEKEKAERGEEK